MSAETFLAVIEAVARDPDHVASVTVHVEADDRPEIGYLLLAGAVDLLAEAASASEADLARALRTLLGAEAALRFEIYERARRAEELERTARMRERGIAMTEGWLVPRLQREIRLFEERVAALERGTRGTA